MVGMLGKLFKGNPDAVLKKHWPVVEETNALERQVQSLSEEELAGNTARFRERLASGEALDDLMPEVFAAVRESARRATGMRHFDVQIIGGMVLHEGKITEMGTGEGKTLVATLAAYLNALNGNGVHIITVNDYLAKRDTQWMGPVYHSLGMSVACLQHERSYVLDPEVHSDNPAMNALREVSRKEAYNADITYGTNHEYGFDYLQGQHGGGRDSAGAARPPLRHCGRGGQHPHRRGADAADHQRAGAGGDEDLRHHGAPRSPAGT